MKTRVGPQTKLLLNLRDAAKLLSLSERTLWGLANTGAIPSFKIGRSRRFSIESLERWIETQEGAASDAK